MVAAAVGVPAALVAAIRNRSKLGFFVGVVALVGATVASGLGAVGVVIERDTVDVRLADAKTETERLRERRLGYEEAKRWARAGLILGVAPLFGGLAGVLAPVMRRRRPRPMSVRLPRSLRSQARQEFTTKTGTTSLTTSALALLAFGACAIAWALPLPGPNIPPDSPAWDARAAIEEMKTGNAHDACARLEDVCTRACDGALVPYLASAASECFELRLEEAEEAPDRSARLDALSRTALPINSDDRRRVRQEIDAMPR